MLSILHNKRGLLFAHEANRTGQGGIQSTSTSQLSRGLRHLQQGIWLSGKFKHHWINWHDGWWVWRIYQWFTYLFWKLDAHFNPCRQPGWHDKLELFIGSIQSNSRESIWLCICTQRWRISWLKSYNVFWPFPPSFFTSWWFHWLSARNLLEMTRWKW